MVQVREITKAEMWQLYLDNVLQEIVNLDDRIVAHNVGGQGDNPDGYEVVYYLKP